MARKTLYILLAITSFAFACDVDLALRCRKQLDICESFFGTQGKCSPSYNHCIREASCSESDLNDAVTVRDDCNATRNYCLNQYDSCALGVSNWCPCIQQLIQCLKAGNCLTHPAHWEQLCEEFCTQSQ